MKFHPMTKIFIIVISIYFLCGCNSTEPRLSDETRECMKIRFGEEAFNKEFPPKPPPLGGLTELEFFTWDRRPKYPSIYSHSGPWQYTDNMKIEDFTFWFK